MFGDGLGHQFITLTVDTCIQHGGYTSLRLAGSVSGSEDLYL